MDAMKEKAGARSKRRGNGDLLESIASLLKMDINLEESREFAAEVLKESSHAVRSKVGETTQVLDQVIKKEAGGALQRIASGAESALQKIQKIEEGVADGIGEFASGFKERGARVADEIDGLADKILREGVEKAAIADQFVKERGDDLSDAVGVAAQKAEELVDNAGRTVGMAAQKADELVDNAGRTVGMAAKKADELVDNAGRTVGMAAQKADELVDNAGRTVGMAAQKADELVDTAASTAMGLRDNTTHIVGGILKKSTKNVMDGIETLEWVPEWKEVLDGLHRNLESTVHDQWDRFHGLEVLAGSDDTDGYEYMEGESYEAMMELSKHLCSDVHSSSSPEQQPATGLCSVYHTECSSFGLRDMPPSSPSFDGADGKPQQPQQLPLTGSAAYRRSYDSVKSGAPRAGLGVDSKLASPSLSVEMGGSCARRNSSLMQTTPGSYRHVASLAVKMQELGMSEDIIRSNLDESLKSPATLISPHANASDSSSRKSSSFDSKHHSWNSEVPPRSLASGTGVSHQDMPPISRERMTLLDSVRFRVTELANAGGPFLKGLVERYAHLLNNAVFVERYLVSRDSNVEVTARKLLAHFEWRMVYRIDGIMDEDWSDLDASGELMLAGLDKQGHSGWIWKLCKHDQNRCSAERGARHIVCMMERALARSTTWDQRIIGMCDCSNMTPANMDLAMLRITIPLMQEQYPEVQSQTLLFPSGWLTTSLYAIISPMMAQGTKKKLKFVSDAEARSILRSNYDMDQVDGCYGGTLVRGPLFSLPGGSGSLRPEDVDRGVEQLEAGRRDAPAASRIDHCEESASSPSRGPRAGPSPIKSSPTAAARKYYGDEDGGDKHGGCVIASRCGGGNVKEADSQDVGVGEREPDSDDRGQEGEGGHHARRRRYKPCSNGQDDDEQAMAGLRVEKGEGEAEPDAANRRGVRERAVEEEVDALSRQEDAVLHGESSTRESGRRSSMINQGAICAAVVGAAALTAAASRSREPQDLVGAVTSICTLLASAMAIMSFSRRG